MIKFLICLFFCLNFLDIKLNTNTQTFNKHDENNLKVVEKIKKVYGDDYYINGKFVIDNNTLQINSSIIDININKPSFYKQIINNETNYILLKLNNEYKQKVSSVSFAKVNEKYVCSIDYNFNNEKHIILCDISKQNYDYINSIAKNIDYISNDDEGSLFENKQNNGIMTCVNDNGSYLDYVIPDGKYDSYTSKKGIIYDYVDKYFSEYVIGTKLCENRIIDIVPKELFSRIGSSVYIGEKYGFYINTGYDYYIARDYVSDVMVFDINYYAMNYKNPTTDPISQISISVKPLFQYRYATRLRKNNSDYDSVYYSNGDSIVVAHTNSGLSNYYLQNIYFETAMRNGNSIDYGELNYNPNYDNGEFFDRVEATDMIGCRYTRPYDINVMEKAKLTGHYIFGYLPYIGPIISTYDYLDALHESFEDDKNDFEKITDAKAGTQITLYHNSRRLQVENYGTLIKTGKVTTNQNFLFSNYADSIFSGVLHSSREISSVGEATTICSNLSFSIYGEDYGPSITISSQRTRNTINKYFGVDERQYSCKDFNNNEKININQKGFEIRAFVPTSTDNYLIQTIGDKDTKITIMDSFYNELATDDNSGVDSNACVSIKLEKGKKYLIKTSLNNDEIGETILKINKSLADEFVSTGTKSIYIDFGENKKYGFIPKVTKNYKIKLYKTGGDADPELYIYDSNMKEIGYNDDFSDENSQININLTEGKIYYIKCQMISDDYCGTLYLSID